MKTKNFMPIILGATMIIMAACTPEGELVSGCESNILQCAKHCLDNPNLPECSGSSVEEYPGLQVAIDSLRAVSKLPIRD